jgi:hypothetical protein
LQGRRRFTVTCFHLSPFPQDFKAWEVAGLVLILRSLESPGSCSVLVKLARTLVDWDVTAKVKMYAEG